jgi:hypothetical protein
VGSTKFDAEREKVFPVNYAERAKSKPLDAKQFAIEKPFNAPIVPPKAKRGVPDVLPAEELRVATGYDAFELKPQAAGNAGGNQQSQLKPQAWAVVTALVPVEKQRQAFQQAFAQAMGGDQKRDTVTYLVPILQRTEAANPKEADWKAVEPAKQFEEQWTSPAPEIVALKYKEEALTGKLPPAKYTTWGEAVSHPKVLLQSEEGRQKQQPAAAPAAVAQPAAQDAQPPGPFANVQNEPAPAPQPSAAAANAQEPVIEHLLLRIFDYTVQPGKRYRYRVLLGIDNPNYKQPAVYLQKPESAASQYLASAPSAATGVVTIPDGHNVLAGVVDGGSRYSEPSATIAVTAFDPQTGAQVGAELPVRRGSVANVMGKEVSIRAPGGEIKKATLDFKSDILVLDIMGGQTLPGKRRVPALVSPGEVLLMDSDGNLSVRGELDDRASYDKTVVKEEPPAPPPEEKDKDKPAARPGTKPKTLLNSDADKRRGR